MYGRNQEGLYAVSQPYRDFDVSFQLNPVTRDLITLSSNASIEQSVRLLVLTQFYERAYRPYLGTKLASALFEIPTAGILNTLAQDLTTYINRYEPRVVVQNVEVSSLQQYDQNSIAVVVEYIIRGQQKLYQTEILLKRIR